MNQDEQNISNNLIETAVVRHGESFFNKANDNFLKETGEEVTSELAKRQFQFDKTLIDAGLTEFGKQQAIKVQNQSNWDKIDIVFVSPLKRALQTAQLIFQNKDVQFIVLPQLTQILSKICDISSSISQKKKQFPQMNFSQFNGKQSTWQINLLPDREKEFTKSVLSQTPSDQQVISLLYELIQHHFPNSTQNRLDCSIRCTKVKSKIASISRQKKVSKIAIIAHRRVILEMTKDQNHPQGIVMKNCQSKVLILE